MSDLPLLPVPPARFYDCRCVPCGHDFRLALQERYTHTHPQNVAVCPTCGSADFHAFDSHQLTRVVKLTRKSPQEPTP